MKLRNEWGTGRSGFVSAPGGFAGFSGAKALRFVLSFAGTTEVVL
jgi:hypothetical protein